MFSLVSYEGTSKRKDDYESDFCYDWEKSLAAAFGTWINEKFHSAITMKFVVPAELFSQSGMVA